MKYKIGVIGAGSISEFHLNGYRAHPDVEIAAICDVNEERARAKAEKYGASRVYTDYRELLNQPDIDGVSVCTWNNMHAEIAIAALEVGKHVLVEKPLCKTMDEALSVQEAAKKSGKVLQVGVVRRYDANVEILKQFIDNGEFGEIYYAKASWLRRLGNPGGWFADIERSGGGPLIDLGVHLIDICWYLMGKPKVKSVSGNTYKKLGNRSNVKHIEYYKAADYDPSFNTVEDLANAIVRFENGASLMVDVSFTLHGTQKGVEVSLYGERGGIILEPELKIITEKYDTILEVQPQMDHPTFDFTQAFANEMAYFVAAMAGEKETLSPVEDGVELMKILTGIYESARLGKEVHF